MNLNNGKPDSYPPKERLKETDNELSETTRQALLNAGLLSEKSDNEDPKLNEGVEPKQVPNTSSDAEPKSDNLALAQGTPGRKTRSDTTVASTSGHINNTTLKSIEEVNSVWQVPEKRQGWNKFWKPRKINTRSSNFWKTEMLII